MREGQHLAHFYLDERGLGRTVARYVIETLGWGGIAVVAAPARRVRVIEAELRRAGVDLAAAHEAGRYFTLDSEPLARRLMIDGRLDRDRVDAVLGEILAPTAGSQTRSFAYGEISPLLWEAGRVDAALAVESRADELVAEANLTLLCGYRSGSLLDAGDDEAVRNLCLRHTYLTSLPFSQ